MRLVQLRLGKGERRLARVSDDGASLDVLYGPSRLRDVALDAARRGTRVADVVAEMRTRESIDFAGALSRKQVLAPIDHPDPAHLLVTGTGLTHLGSAQARDSMHEKLEAAKEDEAQLTDSMKMFKLGLEGGKPAKGKAGVQPEWFFKGDGGCIVAPEEPLAMPAFAEDGGEEAELALIYIIDDDGRPRRIGCALGNEFSDHVMEKRNYLYLAHSKLRACSFGPAVLLGDVPGDIHGKVRVRRGSKVLWQDTFLTGETNMSHTLANLEHHHFKYGAFRRPGDIHVHFIGAATLSFANQIKVIAGDVFEIEAPPFAQPLRNPLAQAEDEGFVSVEPV